MCLGLRGGAMAALGLHWRSLEERKHGGENLYYELYLEKMKQLPKDVQRFCDPQLPVPRRKELLKLLRDLDDDSSCQHLQILFSFSVPSPEALELLSALHLPLVSAGAGTGYWEFLLRSHAGVDVLSFDTNIVYPPEMRYTEILTSGPEILEQFPERGLLLSWPDTEESSMFSLDCLAFFQGETIIHIGELLGETLSANPWGQSTARDFQLALATDFCCVKRMRLPNWPGHMDSLSIWKRKNPQPVLCDGAHFHYVNTDLAVHLQ
ncbi:uncharacterized protein LOC115456511 [Microcaecilia unicolor]|uniref:Uncharacterized protein LOC115456511 n=1 Tax=Microcaecilia unicolor TaxID=1415580 RepID=A0A6P7WKK0_9AMPH|nr:uncharacterized protein LOC115456511 [Microcaecilia unicolor]